MLTAIRSFVRRFFAPAAAQEAQEQLAPVDVQLIGLDARLDALIRDLRARRAKMAASERTRDVFPV